MYSVKQIAIKLNLSTRAIYRAVESGELEHHRFGSLIRISAEQLEDYLERAKCSAAPVVLGSNELIRKHLDS